MGAKREGSSVDGDVRAGRARPGEELDAARVHEWLRAHAPGVFPTSDSAPLEQPMPPKVTQFSGGASNWTYRLAYEGGPDLVLRRPPAGTKAKSAHDMGREFRIQKALAPVFPFVPEMIAHCDDTSVIGAEFYVMRRMDGLILRRDVPAGMTLPPDRAHTLCKKVLDTLIALHQVDWRAAGLDHLGKGAGYVRRQIEGWTERYEKARTWNVPRARSITGWLRDNIPAGEPICVTHNDFRFDNVVLDREDPTRVLGVLDWELAALGDPRMDVGNALAYWIQADDDPFARSIRRQPTHLPGMFTRREVVAYYFDRTGLRVEPFHEVYGLFRLSVIAQQIYYRYHHGQTKNPAFKNLWAIVAYLQWRCWKRIREA
jgi:aminoglycoside phosphotransferase (APT) family kinase protein